MKTTKREKITLLPLLEYLVHNYEYGYRINIQHPHAAHYYNRFKRRKNIPVWCPLSDEERREFERAFITLVERQQKRQ